MAQKYTQKNYDEDFNEKNQKEALRYALDIRKFEIELYWKRATYFWAFIAAAFAAYGLIQASSIEPAQRLNLSVFISCLGLVFSFGWYCVNCGSKRWQENWEKHVDLLEDKTTGPLYKVTFKKKPSKGKKAWLIEVATGSHPFSVSKINQIISLYVTFLWGFFIIISFPNIGLKFGIAWQRPFIILVTFITCVLFICLGKTKGTGVRGLQAEKRKSEIAEPNIEPK